MEFSSLIFITAFLTTNLICYFWSPSTETRNKVMLAYSLVFYAWGEPVYVLILVGMSFFCWLTSGAIDRAASQSRRKALMALTLAVTLGTLGVFKYSGFFVSNLNLLLAPVHVSLPVPSFALPLGISFYTFQLLTYVVDVYRREVPAQKRFFHVLLYASLFHQCVAGPIVRYGDIENELTERTSSLADISSGINRFAFGLAKKTVLANGCQIIVNALLMSEDDIAAYAAAGNIDYVVKTLSGRSALAMWAGMAFYMFWIYFDFSAYSDMAIGMGRICGLHYKENFDYPYVSASVTEFWRRWHISLGSFFRDYVYIPLGGNRKGMGRQIFNLFVVWALTGLWHGPSWNFVFWGLYFFVLLVFEKFFFGKIIKKIPALGVLYTLTAVYFGWVFFRFRNTPALFTVLKGMFLINGNKPIGLAGGYVKGLVLFFVICVLACTPIWRNLARKIRESASKIPVVYYVYRFGDTVIPLLMLALSVLSLVGNTRQAFLYGQDF